MKFFEKKGVAVTVLVLAIVLSSIWGISKKPAVTVPEGGRPLDESLSTESFAPYMIDKAGILSNGTEKAVNLYNANWDGMVGAIIAVVTDKNMDDLEDVAYAWAEELRLGEDDAILVIDAGTKTYRLVASGGFYDFFSSLSPGFVDSYLYGGNLTWRHGGWHLGATGYCQQFSRLLAPGNEAYRKYYPRGKRFGSAGLHYGKSVYRFVVAGETAVSTEQGLPVGQAGDERRGGSCALGTLHRFTWRPTARYTLSAVQRYYAPAYHSLQAASVSRSSRVQNENGLLVHLRAEPWDSWQMLTYVDFFHHSWPPYGCKTSRTGQEFQYQLVHPFNRRSTLSGRYVLRHTVDDKRNVRHRMRLQYICLPSSHWRLQSTASLLHTLSGTGFSLLQAVRLDLPTPSLALSAVVGYARPGGSRSGMSEYLPTLSGAMGQTFLYGETLHGTLLGRWTSRDGHWRLEARYSMRRVLDASTQGSGLQTIYSPWRNDLAFQLRVKI